MIMERVEYMPFAVFYGSNSQVDEGVTVYQSYLVGMSKFIKTASNGDWKPSKESGVIYPLYQDAESCLVAVSSSKDWPVEDYSSATLENIEAEFQTPKSANFASYSSALISSWSHVAN